MSGVRDILGPSGPLAASITGFEPREPQMRMAEKIENLLYGDTKITTFLCEAPTGVGKSCAYLTPALRYARDGNRIVIATANKTLQDQIVGKDLPALAHALNVDVRWALMKGVASYLCKYVVNLQRRLRTSKLTMDVLGLAEVRNWLETTQDGDQSFAPERLRKIWGMVSSPRDACLARECPNYEECFAFEARRKAMRSQIIVTNFHLLLTEVKLRGLLGESKLLPRFDFLVLDEADNLVPVARDIFGDRIGKRSLTSLVDSEIEIMEADDALRIFEDFWEAVENYLYSADYEVRLRKPGWVDTSAVRGKLLEMARGYRDHAEELIGEVSDEDKLECSRALNLANRCELLAERLEDFRGLSEESTSVYFAEQRRRNWFLVKKRIYLRELLRFVLSTQEYKVLLTSATLTGTFNDFGPLVDELGLEEKPYYAEAMSSVFDHKEQMRLMLPGDSLGHYAKQGFRTRFTDFVHEVALALGGRTMVLFTSWKALKEVEERLRRIRAPYEILVQEDGVPPAALAEKMRRDPVRGSVLLGTTSLWKGVDIPGDALQAVIVEKFPFASPKDPLMDWYEEHEEQVFKRRSVPIMLTNLRQGAGRLIRTKDDVGIVMLCDNRVLPPSQGGKPYGPKALMALPQCPRISSVGEAVDFLRSKGRLKREKLVAVAPPSESKPTKGVHGIGRVSMSELFSEMRKKGKRGKKKK
jgi:ATP-dependent DNA helicase DinG